MAPTVLLIDPDNPENDARNCVLLPLLIVASSVVNEVIAAGPGTVVVVEGATVVVVGATVVVVVDVVVVEVEVVVVVGTAVVVVVLVAIGATVVADVGELGVAVVVGATDEEVVESVVASIVVTVVEATVVLVEVLLEVGEVAAGRVVLVEGVVPDSTVEAEIKGVFIAAVISLETNIAVFVKPLGHIAIFRQRICRELNLVQIGRTPFSAFFDALVVLATHLPEREYFNALLVVMQTVFAVSAFHVTFDSDRPQVPVFVTVRRT